MSQRESGYARKERDLYETPEWVTDVLCPHLPPLTCIWEPACGSGKMVRALRKTGAHILASDLDRGEDFLLLPPPEDRCRAIITNPPYELAQEFCERALMFMERVHGLVAMLLRTDFAHAKSRTHLFRDCPAYSKKIELLKRIVWIEPEPGAKGKSPSFNHAWFLWNWKHEGPPTIASGPAN